MENALDTLLKFNNQTQGRDRIIRLCQYGSRFLWWFSEKYNYDKDLISKLKHLEYTLGTARKLIRLGRSLDVMYGALTSIHLNDLMLRLTLTLAKINQSLFFLTDHVVWIGRAGLVDVDKDKWGRRANKFWFYSITMHFVRDIYEIWKIVSLEMRLRSQCRLPSSGAVSLSGHRCTDVTTPCGYRSLPENIFAMFGPVSRWSSDHKDVVLDTVKNGCDLVIPLAGLGYVKASPGLTGLCGVISSIIGIVAIVDAHTKLQPC